MDDRARDNLRFIRETMERAGSFTALPGWGIVAIGITAVGAAVIASRQDSDFAWFTTWACEAAVAIGIAIWTTLSKTREAGTSLFSGPGRRFAYSFAPPLLVCALGPLVAIVLVHMSNVGAVAGVWLLLCGPGMVPAGAFSAPIATPTARSFPH